MEEIAFFKGGFRGDISVFIVVDRTEFNPVFCRGPTSHANRTLIPRDKKLNSFDPFDESILPATVILLVPRAGTPQGNFSISPFGLTLIWIDGNSTN